MVDYNGDGDFEDTDVDGINVGAELNRRILLTVISLTTTSLP